MKSITKTPPKTDRFDGITIGDELTGPERERTEFICNYCNQNLVKLSDRNANNEEWFCRNCSIAFNLDDESVRHKQELSTPHKDIEPAVATTPGIPDVSIRHTPPLRGGFAELQKKGLKIKNYHTTEKE